MAGDAGGRARVPRSAHAEQGGDAGECHCDQGRLDHRDKAKLKQLAGQLDQDASAASGRDAARLRSLATTLKGLGA